MMGLLVHPLGGGTSERWNHDNWHMTDSMALTMTWPVHYLVNWQHCCLSACGIASHSSADSLPQGAVIWLHELSETESTPVLNNSASVTPRHNMQCWNLTNWCNSSNNKWKRQLLQLLIRNALKNMTYKKTASIIHYLTHREATK